MLPEQLDLFGGPPRPPKRIRVEEPAQMQAEDQPAVLAVADEVVAAANPSHSMEPVADDLPAWVTEQIEEQQDTKAENDFQGAEVDAQRAIELENTAAEDVGLSGPEPVESAAGAIAPISDVIAWLEPEEPLADEEAAAADAAAGELEPAEPEEYLETRLKVEPISDDSILIVTLKKEKEHPKRSGDAMGDMSPDGLNIPPDDILFKRQYYTMRETAGMFGISHSMLRYWENEFDVLQPRKNKKGDRYFRPVDIKNLQLIYHLLKVRKFTIDGAREYLRQHNKALDTFELIQKLEKVKLFLQELKVHL